MADGGVKPQDPVNAGGAAPPQIVKKPQILVGNEPGIGTDPGMFDALTSINQEFKEKTIRDKAKRLGLEYVEIAKTPINPDLLRVVNFETAKSAIVMPFFRIGKDLRVAVTDPEKAETKKLLEDLTAQGFVIHAALTSEEQFKEALKLYEFHKKFVEKEIVTKVEEERQAYEKELAVLADLKEKVGKVTSEEALNIVEVGAIKTRASDIHYEPSEKETRVRFRIDGVLHVIFTINNAIFANMVNQLKYRCGMKLNITNVPQDGRYSFVINERKVDVRASAIPTEFGESFVCRLLDSGKHFDTFEELGFEGDYLEKMRRLTTLSYGMALVCGPTGSGKTTTLYSVLTKYNKPEAKIITLEDPIEYHIDGVSQSQINIKRGYDFGDGLRSILRQDPDVVMIGEIRDLDTASTAAQAALTGHVLLSTLHTNSAIEAIPRLVNMGLPEFIIAPSLHTIVAQRLARRLCKDCAVKKPLTDSNKETISKVLAEIAKIKPDAKIEMPTELFAPVGCEKCSKTGYSGRVVIAEIIDIDDEIKEAILNKIPAQKILELARKKGMILMQEDGMMKVLGGLTTLDEVFRVTNV